MSIVTISRGSYSKGREIAEKVAEKLGYECVSRDILLETSEQFNIPEIKLIRAIHDAPSILEQFTHGKEKKVAYMKVALLKHLQRDNVVYHGLAGHFLVQHIAHALKVRITADMQDRVRLEMERENISPEEALRILKNDDEQRRKWSRHLYGIDTTDVSLYDLVINIKRMTVDDAVEILCHAVNLECFKTTPASQKLLNDLLLAAEVAAALVGMEPGLEVCAEDGIVYLASKTKKDRELKSRESIEKTARSVPGVTNVEWDVKPQTPFSNPWHKM